MDLAAASGEGRPWPVGEERGSLQKRQGERSRMGKLVGMKTDGKKLYFYFCFYIFW
jgi:hypothetical protein